MIPPRPRIYSRSNGPRCRAWQGSAVRIGVDGAEAAKAISHLSLACTNNTRQGSESGSEGLFSIAIFVLSLRILYWHNKVGYVRRSVRNCTDMACMGDVRVQIPFIGLPLCHSCGCRRVQSDELGS